MKDKNLKMIFNDKGIFKTFDINVNQFRNFLITLGFLIISLIVALIFTFLFFQKKISNVAKNRNNMALEISQENTALQGATEKLNNEILEIRTKLTKKAGKSDSFSIFNPINGFKDLRSKSLIKLIDVKTEFQNKKGVIKFNLSPTKKTSGFLFVKQISNSGINFYPKAKKITGDFKINFFDGESFQVSRFRPVVAEFNQKILDENVFYKVFIFSKSGDLLLAQNIGPINTNGL